MHLIALYGESGVDEEDFVLFRVQLRAEQEQCETALHRADGRNAALRCNADVEERADETRSLLLQFRDAGHAGVLRRHALPEGFAFGFDADLFGRESRNAHFEVQEFRSRFVFQYAGDVARLADGRLRDVGDVHLPKNVVQERGFDRHLHRCMLLRAYSYPARNAARFISTIS